MKTNTKLNTKLKELRTRHRWTQQDVAYMVGMSAADVSRLENLRIKAPDRDYTDRRPVL